MVRNQGLIYKKVPDGIPVAGQDLAVELREFDLESAAPAGGIVTKNLYASYDPYMRSRMSTPGKSFYRGPYDIGKPITSFVIATVLKSNSTAFSEGQLIVGLLPIEEYSAVSRQFLESEFSQIQVIQNPKNIDLVNFLGALGMPGLTAYASFYEIGKPKKGETILVSAASGAVGQLVGQFAKREGLRVIGSVGSDEKLNFILKELKFDGGFNYKTEQPADALKRLAPQGIDIYYDNVGGEHLEAALNVLNRYGRIVVCGMISDYNKQDHERFAVKNLILTIPKSLTIRGFLVSDPDIGPKYFEERNRNVTEWLSDGSLKAKTSITDGIENADKGFVGMLQGSNFGKAALKIADT
ncbi:NADP-dependent oxidoreductase RED1 [Erysiphe necator]|nr:NADP-dependent oxidoreductase RED1 [Erysiphe necator]